MPLFKPKEIWKTWRFELKYKLTYQEYLRFSAALKPYMVSDGFTLAAKDCKYLVRSLYFDTCDYQAYHEKINGDYGRIKIRVRSYTDNPHSQTPLRVELKTRFGSAMEKYSTFIPYSIFEEFMHTHHWPYDQDPVLVEFARLYHSRSLRPVLLVHYLREGLQARDRHDLRITFDHKVQSTASSLLFPKKPFFRAHNLHDIILEIKCQNNHPAWLTRLVKAHGLKLTANSKYAQGIQVSRPDVVTPMWSQGFLDKNTKDIHHNPGFVNSAEYLTHKESL